MKILFLLFIFQTLIYADYDIQLSQWAETHHVSYYEHPMRDLILLSRNKRTVSIKRNEPWALFDYSMMKPVAFHFQDDKVLMDAGIAEFLQQHFYPEQDFTGDGYRIAAIILDPGHGGKDPGALRQYSWHGQQVSIVEKDIVLTLAQDLNQRLGYAYPDKLLVLTRDSDEFVSLEERISLANSIKVEANEAIVFISIHVNASLNTRAKGFEAWYLPATYRRELLTEDDVDADKQSILPVLNTMLEEEYTMESILLAKKILDGLETSLGERSPNRGLKEEGWFVVRNAKMPSVLIEVGFLSNEEEAMNLNDPKYLKKIADGMYNGITKFISSFEQTKGFIE